MDLERKLAGGKVQREVWRSLSAVTLVHASTTKYSQGDLISRLVQDQDLNV